MYSNLPWHITTDLAEMFAQISFFEEVNIKVIFSLHKVYSMYRRNGILLYNLNYILESGIESYWVLFIKWSIKNVKNNM